MLNLLIDSIFANEYSLDSNLSHCHFNLVFLRDDINITKGYTWI